MSNNIKVNAIKIAEELCEKASLKKGNIVVIGCSTSEINGYKIGSNSHIETAKELYEALISVFKSKGIFMAVQCCEHLNRAIVIEREKACEADIVNVKPMPKAGGSFATVTYENFENPVVVEFIKADAGIDIGNTFIGMHLKHVAVPVRTEIKNIGEANVNCARTRAKFIGGVRAEYIDEIK